MKAKHPFGIGALAGLLFGIVVLLLNFTLPPVPPETALSRTLELIHWPLSPLLVWLFQASVSHSWHYSFEVCLLSTLILSYWMLLGLLVGFGYWLFYGKRGNRAA